MMSLSSHQHQQQKRIDQLGVAIGLACSIHCVIVLALPGAFSLAGVGFLAEEPVELVLLGAASVGALVAACWGYSKHRSPWIALMFAGALLMLVLGQALHEVNHGAEGIAAFGGLVLAGSHMQNLQRCRACNTQGSAAPAEPPR